MKKLYISIFFMIAIINTYFFFADPADNIMARMDLIYSIVYHHTLNIDAYHGNTIDSSYKDGHFYYSGGPGLPLLGAALLGTYKILSGDNNPDPYNAAPLRIITIAIVSIPAAALAMLLFAFLGNYSVSVRDRFAIILAFSLGTLILPYSMLFYTYLPAVLLCFGAFFIIDSFKEEISFPPWLLLASGFLLSSAFICSFDSILIIVPMTVYTSIVLKDKKKFIFLILGTIPPAVFLLIYNHVCFGSFLTAGIFHMNQPQWAISGGGFAHNLISPKLSYFWNITFLPGRGLFWLSPFLIFCFPGFMAMFRQKEHRMHACLCLAIAVLYLLTNSTFPHWEGGYAPGPRYLIPALLFMCIPIYVWLRGAGAAGRALFYALAAVSAVQMALVTATDPHVPVEIQSPVYAFAVPMLLKGYTAWNLGRLFGLRGVMTLIPYGAFFVLCAAAVVWEFRRGAAAADTGDARKRGMPAAWAASIAVCAAAGFIAVSVALSDVKSPRAGVVRGAVFLQNGYYTEAVGEFTGALGERGLPAAERANLLMDRGLAYQQLGGFKAAAKDFVRAAGTPGRCDAVISAARVMKYELGDIRGAARQFERFLGPDLKCKREKDDVYDAHITIGMAGHLNGKFDGALAEYRIAEGLNPRSEEPHQRIANVYIVLYNRAKKPEYLREAGAELEKARELKDARRESKEGVKETLIRAKSALVLGDYRAAADAANEVLTADRKNTEAKEILDTAERRMMRMRGRDARPGGTD